MVPGAGRIAGGEQRQGQQIPRHGVLRIRRDQRRELSDGLGPAPPAGSHHPTGLDRHVSGHSRTFQLLEQRVKHPRAIDLSSHPGIQRRLGSRIELRLGLGFLPESAIGQCQ